MNSREASELADRVSNAVRELAAKEAGISGEGEGPAWAAMFGCAVTGMRYAGIPATVIAEMATRCLLAVDRDLERDRVLS